MGTANATVGIIGAGQLARMMIEAATPLDLDIRLLAASPMDGAARIWPHVTIGSPDDVETVASFSRTCDVVTFDHELVPEPVLSRLEREGVRMAPSADTLRVAQNKERQRTLFAGAGLPQPRHAICRSIDEVISAAADIGYPVVVKAAQGGYDGRGVWPCPDETTLRDVASECFARGILPIVEEQVRIDRELAVLVARTPGGRQAVYPVVETVQIDGICRQIDLTRAHYRTQRMAAGEIATRVADLIDLTGIMALELFESDGEMLINEIATRPHNSGHYTIEAVATSQFEQHLRAILDLPLGSTKLLAKAACTVNILGPSDGSDPRNRLLHALAMTEVFVHLYGKEARPGRKLGHVTTIGPEIRKCADRAWKAVELLTNEARPEDVR
ncbi:MAG: 5-(carboxyamino)imidazole ribonucleotide synthase [Chloroflexota bacterium]|nr:5-(carboxyamino)imidazole ribonucleotide synthase [Chloroflexota bacterium]